MAVDTFTYLRQIGFSGTLQQMSDQLRRDTTKKWQYDVPLDQLTDDIEEELKSTGHLAYTNSIYTSNRPVNLWDLGGDPTGSVDVSPILNATSGRQVDIPPGYYKVSAQIAVPAYTTWNAERGVTLLVAPGFPATTAVVMSQQDDVRLTGDLTIDAQDIGQFCLQTEGDNFRADGLTVKNSVFHGIYVHGGSDVTFENLRAFNCGSVAYSTSVGLYGSANRLKIDKGHFEGNEHQGIYIAGLVGAGVYSAISQISNISAINNGSTGVDVRIPGSVVSNISATGNVGGGFNLNLQATGVQDVDTVLSNINCYSNLDSATNHNEIVLSAQTRVVANGLKTYSDDCQYGIRLADVNYLVITGSQFIGAHSGFQSAVLVPTSTTTGTNNVEMYGSQFRNHTGTTTPVFNLNGTVDGFKVSGSSIGGSSRGVRYTGPGDISNTDFRGNTWTATLANRFQELLAPTGTNRLPSTAPGAFTNLEPDPSHAGLYLLNDNATPGNQIISDLRNSGYYA